jgi:hypothetical protein
VQAELEAGDDAEVAAAAAQRPEQLRVAVSAAADRQLQPALARQGDDRGDVVRAGGLDDHLRVVVKPP